jgi:hypothetical protein
MSRNSVGALHMWYYAMLAYRVQIRRSFVILSPLVSDWVCILKGLKWGSRGRNSGHKLKGGRPLRLEPHTETARCTSSGLGTKSDVRAEFHVEESWLRVYDAVQTVQSKLTLLATCITLVSSLVYSSALKMETTSSSETIIDLQRITRHYVSELFITTAVRARSWI